MALSAKRSDGPFCCPECGKLLTLKKGTVVVHHFAHKPPVDCAYGSGETRQHMEAKTSLFKLLEHSPRVTRLSLEEPIRKDGLVVRPDVRFALDEATFIAIEFQRVSLDPREIERRTVNYERLNVHVLWIVPRPHKLLSGERYQPRETERYLHSLYYGRVFMWSAIGGLQAVEFGEYTIHVEGRSYYDQYGDFQDHAAHSYSSRRYVTPVESGPLDLLSFKPVVRKAFRTPSRSLPRAKLLTFPGR